MRRGPAAPGSGLPAPGAPPARRGAAVYLGYMRCHGHMRKIELLAFTTSNLCVRWPAIARAHAPPRARAEPAGGPPERRARAQALPAALLPVLRRPGGRHAAVPALRRLAALVLPGAGARAPPARPGARRREAAPRACLPAACRAGLRAPSLVCWPPRAGQRERCSSVSGSYPAPTDAGSQHFRRRAPARSAAGCG